MKKSNFCIMVVDESLTLFLALKQLLMNMNIEICRTDPVFALDNCRIKKPDIILLGIIQNEFYGLSILKELVTENETSTIPVIVITEVNNPKYIDEAFSNGAYDYLIKPFNINELVEIIKEAYRLSYHTPTFNYRFN